MARQAPIWDPEFDEHIIPVKDWRACIAERRAMAAKHKREVTFTESQKKCAQSWNRCAVGEHFHKLPAVVLYRLPTTATCGCDDECPHVGHPIDGVLYRLGGSFCEAIEADNANAAEQILDAIDDRVLELKRKL